MGIARGHPDLAMIVFTQFYADVLAECSRLRVYIDDYIIDSTARDADKLALRSGSLEMQPSQHILPGPGIIVLDKRQGNACLITVAFLAKCFLEESALVFVDVWFDDKDAGQGGSQDVHVSNQGAAADTGRSFFFKSSSLVQKLVSAQLSRTTAEQTHIQAARL